MTTSTPYTSVGTAPSNRMCASSGIALQPPNGSHTEAVKTAASAAKIRCKSNPATPPSTMGPCICPPPVIYTETYERDGAGC